MRSRTGIFGAGTQPARPTTVRTDRTLPPGTPPPTIKGGEGGGGGGEGPELGGGPDGTWPQRYRVTLAQFGAGETPWEVPIDTLNGVHVLTWDAELGVYNRRFNDGEDWWLVIDYADGGRLWFSVDGSGANDTGNFSVSAGLEVDPQAPADGFYADWSFPDDDYTAWGEDPTPTAFVEAV